MKNTLKAKSTPKNAVSPKNPPHSTKNENKSSPENPFRILQKLENQLIKDKNGKKYRAVLLEDNLFTSSIFETISSSYKDRNISITPSNSSKPRSKSFKTASIDLKRGAFSSKQSIIRVVPSSKRRTFTKSKNWRSEVKSPTPGSAFAFVQVHASTVETEQDLTVDAKGKMNELSPWKLLMRELCNE
jgi:hypothetical protein